MNRVTKILALGMLGVLTAASALRAQQVQATLSNDTVPVGQPVQLDVSVTGGQAKVPAQLTVDGLDIRQMGQSQNVQMSLGNGGFNAMTTTVYTYLVMPLREGTFTIPAITVNIGGGKTAKTAPQTLRVGPGGSGGGSMPVRPAIPAPQTQRPQTVPPQVQQMPPTQTQQGQDERPAFGSLIIPKKSAFVGEVVPVEMRFYIDEQYPFNAPRLPRLSGDGFTVMKMSEPVLRKQEVNGRLYNVVVCQTALIPAKAGTLTIPEATLDVEVQVPIRAPRGMDDLFSGLLGQPMSTREAVVKTEPEQLEAKALPRDGRPDDFSGAIGQFSMLSTASPKKTSAGDPVSLNVVVSGRGNFEAMGAPALADSEGWRTYPPKEKFEPSSGDLIGFNGKKNYEFMLLAKEDQTKTPEVKFAFFDPELGKYVELKNDAIAVNARGSSAGGGTQTAVASAATPIPTPQAAPSQPQPSVAQPGDELARNFAPAGFTPLFRQKEFLVANGAMALAWCAALVFALGRMASKSSFAHKSARRREAKQILHQMEGSEAAEFYQRAEDFIGLQLGGNITSDAHAALERSSQSEERKGALHDILARNQELKYSAGYSARGLDAEERNRVLDTLKTLL